jgi:hypothetical protein
VPNHGALIHAALSVEVEHEATFDKDLSTFRQRPAEGHVPFDRAAAYHPDDPVTASPRSITERSALQRVRVLVPNITLERCDA